MSREGVAIVGTFAIRCAAIALRRYATNHDCDAADELACRLTLALDREADESATATIVLDANETATYYPAMAELAD